MTEIEENFFELFNINKTNFDFTCNKKHCNKKRLLGRFVCLECDNETKKEIKVYPQITLDILLKLMCHVVYCIDFRSCKTPEDIKDLILNTLIYNKDYIDKSKVQSLFTGVEESIHNGDEKLNKTLQEIKEIAENEIKELTDSAINGGRYLEILNIIKKAEEEEQ